MKAVVFHNIVAEPMDEFDRQLFRRHINGFARTIKVLRDRYDVISLPEMLARMAVGDPSLDSLCITFDDGFAGNYELAFPLLADAGLVATIFLPSQAASSERATCFDPNHLLHFEVLEIAFRLSPATRLRLDGLDLGTFDLGDATQRAGEMNRIKTVLKSLDAGAASAAQQDILDQLGIGRERIVEYAAAHSKYRKVSVEQIRVLEQAGWTIGSHTRDHFPLSSLDVDGIRAQLEGNLHDIETTLGVTHPPFAYPYGTPAMIGLQAPQIAESVGFRCAFTTVRESFDGSSDRFRLGRFSDLDLLYRVPTRQS